MRGTGNKRGEQDGGRHRERHCEWLSLDVERGRRCLRWKVCRSPGE